MNVHPGRCPICGPTIFHKRGPWLRDDYVCRRCHSIPRHRALVAVARRAIPDLCTKLVFEAAPCSPSSQWLRRRSREYVAAQYFADVPRGEIGPDGARSEDLQALTLGDASVDVFVTQDVFEHIVDPDAAWCEIARVLVPGGVHLWTVPLFDRSETVVRAAPDGHGGVRHVLEPDYHGDAIGGRSLVIHEWAAVDLLARVDAVSRMVTTRHVFSSAWIGVDGPMNDVLLSRKLG